jgi:hypothetical protein
MEVWPGPPVLRRSAHQWCCTQAQGTRGTGRTRFRRFGCNALEPRSRTSQVGEEGQRSQVLGWRKCSAAGPNAKSKPLFPALGKSAHRHELPAGESRAVSWLVGASQPGPPALGPSEIHCALTLRSSRPAPARQPGRPEPNIMLHWSAGLPCLHGRLSSNVRRHEPPASAFHPLHTATTPSWAALV